MGMQLCRPSHALRAAGARVNRAAGAAGDTCVRRTATAFGSALFKFVLLAREAKCEFECLFFGATGVSVNIAPTRVSAKDSMKSGRRYIIDNHPRAVVTIAYITVCGVCAAASTAATVSKHFVVQCTIIYWAGPGSA